MALSINKFEIESQVQETLNEEMEKVRQLIRSKSKSKFTAIQEIVDDVIDLNGKMLRPYMTIVSANFGDYKSEKIVKLASAIEMLHMATLIHDDIVDDSKIRRNKESVQSKYGKDMAVYAGDYLLSKALSMLSADEYDASHMERLAKAVEHICESELLQFQSKFNLLNVKNYLRIISGKTAALFAISMYSGAAEGGCEEVFAKQMGRIGYELGIAFQIIDDILDFSDNQDQVGKTTRNDLKKGYFTLPAIYALQGINVQAIEYSEAVMMDLIKKNKGIEKARVLAQKYTKKAYKRIAGLPESNYKLAVEQLAKMLLDRQY